MWALWELVASTALSSLLSPPGKVRQELQTVIAISRRWIGETLCKREARRSGCHRPHTCCFSYSMGAKYSAVHCMKGSMQQVTEEASDRKAAGYRYRHSQWTQLKTSGSSPSPRSGHDVVVIGNKAYLFGGCGGEQVRHADYLLYPPRFFFAARNAVYRLLLQ